jgi:threonine dehydrogenase-like Zn-dependent dehydrogenase
MKAVIVAPGTAGAVRLEDGPEPAATLGSVVVEALAAGICGTDAEIASGSYGWPAPEGDRPVRHDQAGQRLQRAPGDVKVIMEFAQP